LNYNSGSKTSTAAEIVGNRSQFLRNGVNSAAVMKKQRDNMSTRGGLSIAGKSDWAYEVPEQPFVVL
jgi:hypothetical protein